MAGTPQNAVFPGVFMESKFTTPQYCLSGCLLL